MIRQGIFLAILLFCSCQRSPWQYHHIPEKRCDCTRLSYRSQDRVQGIDIEFLCQGKNMTTYLQVVSQKIPETEGFSKQTRITLKSGEKTHISLATLHEGKQRVHLSDISQMQLINWLQQGFIVTIKIEGYEEEIDPKRFAKLFKKLERPPYKIPFRLPF